VTRRRELSLAKPCPDADGILHALRDNLGRTDAFLTAAEELIERCWGCGDVATDDDSDDSIARRRNHVAHLVGSAKLAVRAAAFCGEQLAKRRQGL
jgi:hypothetical protein